MSDFAIRGIEVHQIGVFENFKLEFPEKEDPEKAEIHIFTGENGSGKSTLLSILAATIYPSLFQKIILPKLARSINASYKGTSHSLKVNLCGYNIGPVTLENTPKELIEYNNSILTIPESNELTFAFFAYSGYRRVEAINLTGIQEIQQLPLANALDFNKSINPQIILQWIANMKSSEYMAIAKNKTLPGNQSKMLKMVEEVISEVIEKNLTFDFDENPFRVVVIIEGLQMSFDTLPDGLKSIISWIADLLMRMQRIRWKDNIPVFERRFILFLDEIEVHLHPAWQRKVLPIIQKLFKNAQIFISTHSPFVVGSVDGAWIYRLKFDGKKTTVAPPTLSEDGESFVSILKEIFDVKEQFGQAVEKELDAFYQMKTKTLQSMELEDLELMEIMADNIKGQSAELDLIVEMEMRQIFRQFSQSDSYLK